MQTTNQVAAHARAVLLAEGCKTSQSHLRRCLRDAGFKVPSGTVSFIDWVVDLAADFSSVREGRATYITCHEDIDVITDAIKRTWNHIAPDVAEMVDTDLLAIEVAFDYVTSYGHQYSGRVFEQADIDRWVDEAGGYQHLIRNVEQRLAEQRTGLI